MTFQTDGLSRPSAADSFSEDKKDARRRRKRRATRTLLDHEDEEWLPPSAMLSTAHVIREFFDNDYDIS